MPGIDRHSRLVGWLKVALPLGALALLSTLFLLADRIDPSDAIPYAEVDVEALARDPRMTAPSYAGTTSDGAAISLTAAAARPATADRTAAAEDVALALAMPDGGRAEIAAGEVQIDTARDEARLSGGVTLTASSGYVLTAPGLVAALDRSHLASTGPVDAKGPPGQISAQSFVLDRQATGKSGETAYLLVFSGGVKLIYLPGTAAPPPDPALPDPNPSDP